MFYLAKLIEASGLTIILFAFLKNFPHLMSYQALGIGVIIFGIGWLMEYFLSTKGC